MAGRGDVYPLTRLPGSPCVLTNQPKERMTMVTTITRDQLMEVCDDVLHCTPDLTSTERMALREVALTAERIAGGGEWWDAGTECGCLVGTWLRDCPRGGPLQSAGDAYVFAVDKVLGPGVAEVLEVTA